MLSSTLNHTTSDLQSWGLYGFERLSSLSAVPPLPLSQLFLLEEVGKAVFARVETVHCDFTVATVSGHTHLKGNDWVRLKLRLELVNCFFSFPLDDCTTHIAGAWKMNAKCQNFITAPPSVPPDLWIEQPPQDQSLPLSPRFDKRTFFASIGVHQNQILNQQWDKQRNSTTELFYQIRFLMKISRTGFFPAKQFSSYKTEGTYLWIHGAKFATFV